ncbi:MAG: AMP-binding protein [Myxococcota bacterium]
MHTFADPLERAIQVAPNKIAIRSGPRSFTYRELHARCGRFPAMLSARAVERGDRVAVLAKNGPEYLEAYVGIPAAGRVIVPLNTRHAEPELAYALKDSGTKLLITDREPGGLRGAVSDVLQLGEAYEQALAAVETPVSHLGEGVTEDSLAGLFYTGGTTGASKGVMLTHRNLIANTISWGMTVPQTPDDNYLVMAPLFHAAGSNGVLATMWTAGTFVPLPAFDPATALDLIEEHQVTQTLAVPAMLAAVTELQLTQPRNVESLKVIAHGGSPIATEVLRRAHRAFPTAQLVELYGATETSPLSVALPGEEKLLDSDKLRATGLPIVGCQLRIVDPQGHEVPRNTVGEVLVKGNNVMRGYWNKPEQTAAVLSEAGYRSGDLGYMDEEGYIYLVDRAKDMIVSGGENVYCTEVEEALYKHEAVLEAAVFGVPDDKWGEAVWATVVLREEHGGTEASSLIEFCRERIAGYKVPKGIDFRTEPLPKSGPGKVLKRQLRAPYWEGRERAVN